MEGGGEEEDGKPQCRICNKVFTLKKNLLQHQRSVHEKLKKHECNICFRKFSRKSHKDTHLRVCSRNVETGPTAAAVVAATAVGGFPVGDTDSAPQSAIETSSAAGSVPIPTAEAGLGDPKQHVCGICRKKFSRRSHRDMHLRICSRNVQSAAGNDPTGTTSSSRETGAETSAAAGGSVPIPPVAGRARKKERSTRRRRRSVRSARKRWEKKQGIKRRVSRWKFRPVLLESAFGGCFSTWTIRFPSRFHSIGLSALLHESTLAMSDIILDTLWTHTKMLKFTMAVHVVYVQGTNPDVETSPPVVLQTDPSDIILVSTDMSECLEGMAQELLEKIETYEANGSGWVFSRLTRLDTDITSCWFENLPSRD